MQSNRSNRPASQARAWPEDASQLETSTLRAERETLRVKTVELRGEFVDLTEQIDTLVDKPAGTVTQSPPTVPGFCDPWPILHPNVSGDQVLSTPSPAEFAELKSYNRAYARKPPEDPSQYAPPFPSRGSLYDVPIHTPMFGTGCSWVAQGSQPGGGYGLFASPEPSSALPTPPRRCQGNSLSQSPSAEAGGAGQASGSSLQDDYAAFMDVHRQRSEVVVKMTAMGEQFLAMYGELTALRDAFTKLTEEGEEIAHTPADVLSQPPPRIPGLEARGPHFPGNSWQPLEPPAPSLQEFERLRAYNDCFQAHLSRDPFVYQPPFPAGRLQLGYLEPSRSGIALPPWAPRPVLSRHDGTIPLEQAMMANKLRGRRAGGDVDPDYGRAAALYERREQVRTEIRPLCERFRALSQHIEQREPSAVSSVPPWHLSEENRKNSFFGWA